MGATGVYSSAQSREQFFQAEVKGLLNGEVIDHVVVGSVIYVAVRRSDVGVYGIVVRTWKANDYWTYSIISEDAGPLDAKCPSRILKLLSPTTSPRARAWREECQRSKKR